MMCEADDQAESGLCVLYHLLAEGREQWSRGCSAYPPVPALSPAPHYCVVLPTSVSTRLAVGVCHVYELNVGQEVS